MTNKGEGKAKRNSRELLIRVLSAAILIPFVVYLVLKGGWHLKGLLAIAAFLLGYEYERLTELPKRSRGVFTAGLFATVFWILAMDQPKGLVDAILVSFIVGPAVIGLGASLKMPKLKWAGFGMSYFAVPLFALAYIYALTGNPYWILWTLAVIWGCDSGAFAVGKLIGGPKLAPAISPNKTWAGFFGGMLAGALAGALGAHFFMLGDVMTLGAGAALLAIWGQAGDLAESFIKRRFKAKDSGYFIPGHGGVLDRLDALLFAAPAVALYLGTIG